MNYDFKKNISIILLFTVVSIHFFIYLGSALLSPSLPTSLLGYTDFKPKLPYLVDWVWVTIIGRIIGAYILCKLALRLGFIYLMRIVVVLYILLALSVSSANFTDIIVYKDVQLLFVHRFINAFLMPAPFMLVSLFLLNQKPKKPIMLSACACLAVGLGAILIYKSLAIIKFANGWQNIMLCSSIIGGICYVLFEKYTPNKTDNISPTTIKLDFNKIFLVSVFGGTCGITFSYHFAFLDSYINNIIICCKCVNCHNVSFAYYYYALLISIIPVARFIYGKSIFTPLKISVVGINLIAIIITIIPEITFNIYVAEQVLFGILSAMLIVPCHALVYEIFKDTPNYFEGMFWFVTFFSIFAVTPHFFLRLLGINSMPWLSLLYVIPISSMFIFAINRYEQKTMVSS
ncbi:MAG: hypothetical protein NT128_05895 [Proteobacteria bacterium]|nr:hypothetical protein [Pseudomonadota bacterium]